MSYVFLMKMKSISFLCLLSVSICCCLRSMGVGGHDGQKPKQVKRYESNFNLVDPRITHCSK